MLLLVLSCQRLTGQLPGTAQPHRLVQTTGRKRLKTLCCPQDLHSSSCHPQVLLCRHPLLGSVPRGPLQGIPSSFKVFFAFIFSANERCGHDAEHPAQWSPTATLHRREHGHQHSHLAMQDGRSLSIFPFLPCFFSPVRAQQLQPCDSHFVLSSCWWYFGPVAEQALCPLQSRLRLPHCCSASCSAARPGQLRGGQQELEEFVLLETTSLR